MKMAAAFFAALVLLAFSGCRSSGAAPPSGTGAPSPPASAASQEPDASRENGQAGAGAFAPAGEEQPGVSPGGAADGKSESQTGGVPSESQAEALDDILKVLSELDRLYSQLDDVSDSDLAE